MLLGNLCDPLLPSSEPPFPCTGSGAQRPPLRPALPRDPTAGATELGAVLAVWTQPVSGGVGHRPGDRLGPSKAEVGESWGGGRGLPSPLGSRPARRRPGSCDLVLKSCSGLHGPPAPSGSGPPPPEGPRAVGGGAAAVTAPGSPSRQVGAAVPSPAPGPGYNPGHVPPEAPKAGPRFWNTWRGRGPGPPGGGRREKGLGARLPPPRKEFLLPWRILKRSCQRRLARGQDSASCRCLLN